MNNLRFHVWLFRKVVSRLDVELLKSFVVDCHRLFTIDGYRRHIEICAATARYKNTQLVLSIGNHIDKERENRTSAEECDRGEERSAIGTIKARLPLHYSCGM